MRTIPWILAALPLAVSPAAHAFPAGSGAAAAGDDLEAQVVEIEAYLDEAPDDATVVADLAIAAPGEDPRRLKVVHWRQPGVESAFDLETTMSQGPLTVKGEPERVEHLFDAKAGTRIAGLFEAFGHHYLVIRDLSDGRDASTR